MVSQIIPTMSSPTVTIRCSIRCEGEIANRRGVAFEFVLHFAGGGFPQPHGFVGAGGGDGAAIGAERDGVDGALRAFEAAELAVALVPEVAPFPGVRSLMSPDGGRCFSNSRTALATAPERKCCWARFMSAAYRFASASRSRSRDCRA